MGSVGDSCTAPFARIIIKMDAEPKSSMLFGDGEGRINSLLAGTATEAN